MTMYSTPPETRGNGLRKHCNRWPTLRVHPGAPNALGDDLVSFVCPACGAQPQELVYGEEQAENLWQELTPPAPSA